jgi:hypothetical protein
MALEYPGLKRSGGATGRAYACRNRLKWRFQSTQSARVSLSYQSEGVQWDLAGCGRVLRVRRRGGPGDGACYGRYQGLFTIGDLGSL